MEKDGQKLGESCAWGQSLGGSFGRDLSSNRLGQVSGAGRASPTRALSAEAEDISQDTPTGRGSSRQGPPRGGGAGEAGRAFRRRVPLSGSSSGPE